MATDDRLTWIDKRLHSSLECKGSLSSIDAQMLREIFQFFERMDYRTLFAAADPDTHEPQLSLVPMKVPADQKLLVFRKTFGVSSITEADIAKQLVVCELVATPWYHLWLVSRDVYLPLLSAAVDNPPVPHLPFNDAKRVHEAHLKLLSTMQMTEGHMQGKVMLPLPLLAVAAGAEGDLSERMRTGRLSTYSAVAKSAATSTSNGLMKEHIHQLESALIAWSKVIKGLLKLNINEVVRQVKHPGPHVELQAFELRQRHLESVHAQLHSMEVQAIVDELDAAASNYVTSFSNLLQEVKTALDENSRLLKMLRACKPYFDCLADSSVPIPVAVKKVPPMLHSLFLLWQHSDWYRKAKRFQRLLRFVCNQIIRRSQETITTTPHNNFPHGLEDQLRTVLRLCASFRGTYLDVRDQAQTVALNLVRQQFTDDRHISVAMSSKQEVAMQQTFKAALAAWPERSEGPFKRFNSFIDRCNDILDLAESVHHFKQLRYLALGGPHGQRLTAGIAQVYAEFVPALEKFEAQRLNLVNIDDDVERFNEEFFELRLTVRNLERVLVRVLKEAHRHCSSLQQRLDVFDMFDNISMREAIVTGLENEHMAIIHEATQHYRDTMEVLSSPVSRFRDDEAVMAPPSHASRKLSLDSSIVPDTTPPPEFLTYRRATPFIDEMVQLSVLEQRIKDPWRVIEKLPQACLLSKAGHDLQVLHATAEKEIANMRKHTLSQWHMLASQIPGDVLTSTLFVRQKMMVSSADEAALASRHRLPVFQVNLPLAFLRRLREAQFLQRRGYKIGETMEMLCERQPSLHVVVAKLDMVLGMYNHLRVKLDKFERPLYHDMFPNLVEALTKGTVDFNFSSSSLHDYLATLEDLLIKGFQTRLDTVAGARKEMDAIVERWKSITTPQSAFADDALEQRPFTAESFEEYHLDCMKRVRSMLVHDSNRLEELVQSCLTASYVTESSPAWEAFIAHLDDKIASGVYHLVSTALHKLYQCLHDPQSNVKAVIGIEVSVTNGTVVQKPPLVQAQHAAENTLVEIVDRTVTDVLQLATCVKSPRTSEVFDLARQDNVRAMVDAIHEAVTESANHCQEQLHVLDSFQLLFHEDPSALFNLFLQDRRMLASNAQLSVLSKNVTGQALRFDRASRKFTMTNRFGRMHDLATLSDRDVDDVPTLEEFSSCLHVFKAAQQRLRAMPDTRQLGWLQLDMVPINATLRALASKWLYTFGTFILDCAEGTIEKLKNYLDWTEDGIVELKSSGSHFSFMKLMNFFHDVSLRQEETDGKLGPLQRTLSLLEKYDLQVPVEEREAYAAFPERMQVMRKKLEDLKRGLAPRISKEAERIKQQLVEFDMRLRDAFDALLSSDAFVSGTPPDMSRLLIADQTRIFGELERQSRDLSQLQQLTNMSIVDFGLLTTAKQTLAHVDEVTSLRLHFNEQLGGVLSARWTEADLDTALAKAESMLELIHALPEDCFEWDVTQGLQRSTDAIIKSVPLLENLKKEDLRSSHWKKLFRDAGVTETLDESTVSNWTLREMLYWLPKDQPSLVESVVALAAKDIRSENALRLYEEKWMTAVFTLKPWYPGLGINERVTSSLRTGRTTVSQRYGRNSRLRTDSRDRRASGISSRGSVMSEKGPRSNELTAAMLVSGLDDLFGMLANNRSTIEFLHTEKGYGSRVMASEIASTEARLKTIDEVLTTLRRVQELWITTSEAFVTFMHDQQQAEGRLSGMKHSMRMTQASLGSLRHGLHPNEKKTAFDRELQREIQMFQSTDNEFRSLLASIQRDPAVVGLCLRPGVLNLLNNIQQNFSHIKGALQRFFYNHCDMLPRLYFLSPPDVLAVQTYCGHPGLISRALNLVFPGISAIEIEDRNQTNIVTGVTAATGEKVEFDVSFIFKGPAVVFLDTLTSKIKEFVRNQIMTLLRDDQMEGILSPFTIPGEPVNLIQQQLEGAHADADDEERGNDGDDKEGGVGDDDDDGDEGRGDRGGATSPRNLTSGERRSPPHVGRGSHGSIGAHLPRKRAASAYSMNWTMDRLAQCVAMALLVKNTQEIDALVAKANTKEAAQVPRLLKELHDARVLQVNEMQSTLASAHSTADRQKMTTIIAFLIYLRDVASRLSDNPSSLASAPLTPQFSANTPSTAVDDSLPLTWEASSVVRCHCNEEGDLLVQLGTTVAPYSFEVVEPSQAMCLTDLSERYWFGVMRASSLGLGAIVTAETRSSPAHTMRSLAYLLGRPLHTVCCTQLTSFQLLAQALKGMATMDSVLVLENVSCLPESVLASLADTVRSIMQAVRSEASDVVRIGRGPPVRVSTQPVCVLSHASVHHEPLPVGVRQTFRTISASLPHSAFVAEAMLSAHGFHEASKLATSLHRFATIMASIAPRPLPNQLPHPLSCTWGLPFTQRVITFVMATRPEPPAVSGLSEEEEVTSAILSLVGSRVNNATDRQLFLAALRQCFDAAHRVDDATLIMDVTHLPSTLRRFNRPLGPDISAVLDEMGLSLQGHLPASVEKLNALLHAHRVVYVVGSPNCGKSECVRGLAAALRRQGLDVETASIPCGYLTSEELIGTAMGTGPASKSMHSQGQGALIPLLLQQLRESLEAQAASEGTVRSRDQQVLRTKWLVLEGPVPDEVRARLVLLEDTGLLPLPDGSYLRVHEQIRVVVLSTPDAFDSSTDTATPDYCGVLRLDDANDLANACKVARHWVTTVEERYSEHLAKVVQQHLKLFQEFWAKFMGKLAHKRRLHCALGVISTATALFGPCIDACVPEGSKTQTERFLAPCFNFCLMWACLGPLVTVLDEQVDAKQQASDWWRTRSAQIAGVEFPSDKHASMAQADRGPTAVKAARAKQHSHRHHHHHHHHHRHHHHDQQHGGEAGDGHDAHHDHHRTRGASTSPHRHFDSAGEGSGTDVSPRRADGGATRPDTRADAAARYDAAQHDTDLNAEREEEDEEEDKLGALESVLSYRVDQETGRMTHWSKYLPEFVLPPARGIDSHPIETAMVPTVRMEATKFVTQLSLQASRNVLLLGQPAAGKSALLQDIVETQTRHTAGGSDAGIVSLQGSERLTPSALWRSLHKQLESPSGRAYVPAGSRRQLVCVVDDIDTTQALQSGPPAGDGRDHAVDASANTRRHSSSGGGGSGAAATQASLGRSGDGSAPHDMNVFFAGEQGMAPDADPLREKRAMRVSSTGKFMEQLSVHGFTFDAEGRCRQVNGVTCLMSATLDMNEEVYNAFLTPSFSRNCTVLVLPLADAQERGTLYNTLLTSHFFSKKQQETRHHKQTPQQQRNPIAANPRHYTEWVGPIVHAAVELHDLLCSEYNSTRERCLYRFDERDLKHSLVEFANRLEPFASLELVVFVWSTVLATVYSRRMVSQNDITRFRTLLQNVVRKRFFRDLLPSEPALPVWLCKHDAFLTHDIPVDHEHDESVMLCPRELVHAVLNKGKGGSASSATSAGSGSGRGSGPRVLDGDQHAYVGGTGGGGGGGVGKVRPASVGARALYKSLKNTLSSYFMDSEGHMSTLQMKLPGTFVVTIAEVVEHMRQAKYRTNFLLRMPRVKEIVQLCGTLAGFEVMFAQDLSEHRRVRSQFVDLVMRAGTRDEKIVFAVSLAECPAPVLSMLASFVTSGEIGDLLSPDNLVAVSTLSQPKVIQAGLQPSLKNSWAFFKRTIRQNLRLVFYVPERGPSSVYHQLRLIAFNPSLVSNLLVFAQPQPVPDDLSDLAASSLQASFHKLQGLYDEAVVTRLTPLMMTMHKIVADYTCSHLNDQLALAHVTTSHFDTFVNEAAAMLKLQWQYISEEAVSREQGLSHTRDAQEHVQELKSKHDDLLSVWNEKDAITTRLLTQIGRDLAALKRSQAKQATQEHDLNELKQQLPTFKEKYDAAMSITTKKLKLLRRHVGKLNDSNIRVLQMMARVSDNIELVFACILILLNNYSPEDVAELDLSWRMAGRRLCSDVNRLRQSLQDAHSAEISPQALSEIKVLFESSDIDLPVATPFAAAGDDDDDDDGDEDDGDGDGGAKGEEGDGGDGANADGADDGNDGGDDGDEDAATKDDKGDDDAASDEEETTSEASSKTSKRKSKARRQTQGKKNSKGDTEAGDTDSIGADDNDGGEDDERSGRSTSPAPRSSSPQHLSPSDVDAAHARRLRRRSSMSPLARRMSMFREQDEEEEPEAYKILLQWLADAVSLHDHLNEVARPLEHEYNGFVAEIDRRQAGLEDMQRSCSAIANRVAALQKSFDTSTRVKNDHRKALADIAEELQQAQAFLETLRDEQASWHESLSELQEEALYVEANALMSAAIRTYLPALSHDSRVQIISLWVESMLDKGLRIASEVKVHGRASVMRRVSTQGFEQSLLRAASARSVPEAEDETQILDLDTILPQLCGKPAVIQGAQHGDDEFFFINRSVLAWPKSWNLVLDPHGFGVEHIVRIETGQIASCRSGPPESHASTTANPHEVQQQQDDVGSQGSPRLQRRSKQQSTASLFAGMHRLSTDSFAGRGSPSPAGLSRVGTARPSMTSMADHHHVPSQDELAIVDMKFGTVDWMKLQMELEDAFASQLPVLLLNAPAYLDDNLHHYLLSIWQRMTSQAPSAHTPEQPQPQQQAASATTTQQQQQQQQQPLLGTPGGTTASSSSTTPPPTSSSSAAAPPSSATGATPSGSAATTTGAVGDASTAGSTVTLKFPEAFDTIQAARFIVDRNSALRAHVMPLETALPFKSWDLGQFAFMLGVVEVNTFLAFNHFKRGSRELGPLSRTHFRGELIRQLVHNHLLHEDLPAVGGSGSAFHAAGRRGKRTAAATAAATAASGIGGNVAASSMPAGTGAVDTSPTAPGGGDVGGLDSNGGPARKRAATGAVKAPPPASMLVGGDHRLLTAPTYSGKFVLGQWTKVATKYNQHKCTGIGCTRKIRTYCSCDPTSFLCARCFVVHFSQSRALSQQRLQSDTDVPQRHHEHHEQHEQQHQGQQPQQQHEQHEQHEQQQQQQQQGEQEIVLPPTQTDEAMLAGATQQREQHTNSGGGDNSDQQQQRHHEQHQEREAEQQQQHQQQQLEDEGGSKLAGSAATGNGAGGKQSDKKQQAQS